MFLDPGAYQSINISFLEFVRGLGGMVWLRSIYTCLGMSRLSLVFAYYMLGCVRDWKEESRSHFGGIFRHSVGVMVGGFVNLWLSSRKQD